MPNTRRKEYDEAVSAARRYVTLHPGSPDAAYAQYLIGSAYYDQIPDVTRDQGRTEKAIAALEEVTRKYPDSEYAQNAKRKIEMARDQLAGKEMMIGRYYLNRKEFTGAINRFKIVVTQYQTTRHVEEALMRLTEAYMALGIVQEAQTAAAVLGHNFPDSRWYRRRLPAGAESGGLEPSENKGSWISRAFAGIPSPLPQAEVLSAIHKLRRDGARSRGPSAMRPACSKRNREIPGSRTLGGGMCKDRACWPGFRSETSF